MPTAIHARGRLLAAACPQMSRMNVGHRPAIHSPHRHPPRTAGFGRPRRPLGAARPFDPPPRPALGADLSEGRCSRDLFLAGAMRRPAGCGTGTGVPPSGGGPTRGGPRDPRYRPLGEPTAAPLRCGGLLSPASPPHSPWGPPFGARLTVYGGSKVGSIGAPRRATLRLPAALASPPK